MSEGIEAALWGSIATMGLVVIIVRSSFGSSISRRNFGPIAGVSPRHASRPTAPQPQACQRVAGRSLLMSSAGAGVCERASGMVSVSVAALVLAIGLVIGLLAVAHLSHRRHPHRSTTRRAGSAR